jgi:integrase
MVSSGTPLTGNATRDYIKRRVYKLTGKAVTPHLIRSMYISYLEESGTPEYIMESTARSMHHSRSTQRRHYDKRQKSKKMQPGLDLAVEIARSILHN